MKYSRREISSRAYKIPELRFEDQNLTSFAGLIIFQPLFPRLRLKDRLRGCFRHGKVAEIFGHHLIMMLLVVHLLLGFRRLRDLDYYQDDPIVQRLLGLKRLPDVSTVCRALKSTDEKCIQKIRGLVRQLVMERLRKSGLSRLTLDFDGSVLFTPGRKAEGTAVGFKKKKGARSYYPLSVPFERFVELKGLIESRLRWRRLQKGCTYFETPWKPKKWKQKFRFLFIRQTSNELRKGLIQLDLFIPFR